MNQQNNLTEKDLMNDLLTSEKQICSSYSTGITESSCDNLRKQLRKCLDDSQQIQYDLFNAMNQRGWYQTKKAEAQEVQNAQTKYSEEKNQLF